MILRLHHHLAEVGAGGLGGRAFSWEPDPRGAGKRGPGGLVFA